MDKPNKKHRNLSTNFPEEAKKLLLLFKTVFISMDGAYSARSQEGGAVISIDGLTENASSAITISLPYKQIMTFSSQAFL